MNEDEELVTYAITITRNNGNKEETLHYSGYGLLSELLEDIINEAGRKKWIVEDGE